MPDEPTRAVPGRAVVARRALGEIVRDAVLGSYGVTGLAEPTLMARCRARLGLGSRAVRLTLHPTVETEVWLSVAYGVPVAEVARQVDSAVRYRLERALGRPVGPVAIHVQGLGGQPYTAASGPGPAPRSTPAVAHASAEPPAAAPDDAGPSMPGGVSLSEDLPSSSDGARSGSAAGAA